MSHTMIRMVHSFLMITAGIITAASGQAAISDANWESMGGMPGVDQSIHAITSDGKGNFYAAGSCITAGGVLANHIAKWDGNSWSALGSGTNSDITDISLDRFGNLYVVGYFDTAGGIPVNHIAKWNGSEWSSLGSGLAWTNDSQLIKNVSAVTIDASGNVYAGGDFDIAGGVAARNIAKWDGTTWSSLGSGVSSSVKFTTNVQSLAVDSSGNLYTGGRFDSIGGIAVNHIAKWDGNAWNPLGSGADSMVLAVAVDGPGNLYAGGCFTNINGVPVNHIARWDGTAWSALDSGVDFSDNLGVEKYCISIDNSGNVYMGGRLKTSNHLVKWNGEAWSVIGSGINQVYSLHVDNEGMVYVGAGGRITKWDGNAWSQFGCYGTDSRIYSITADSSNNLYAAGNFTVIGNNGTAAKSIARWDGNAWSALESQAGHSFIYSGGLSVGDGGTVYAIGYLDLQRTVVKWDGTEWNDIGGTISGYTASLAVDRAGNLYAGGTFDTAGGKAVNHIARWDGNTWNALGGGMKSRSENVIRVSMLTFDESGNLYAAGLFDTAGTVAANNIAKWDGKEWSALGSGINSDYSEYNDDPVYALLTDSKGNLYAGGYFSAAGGVPAKNIAKWDGNTWSALGSGIDHVVDLDGPTGVFALTIDKSGNLYAGGGFDTAGSIPANFIARWDGSAWSALGSGVFGGNVAGMYQSAVFALAVDSTNTLYVGGEFLSAGNKTSPYIAKCNLNGVASRQPRIVKTSPACRLAFDNRSKTIRCTMQSTAAVSYRIYTLDGREVFHNAATLRAGTNSIRIKTKGLSRGVYIGQVSVDKELMRFKMVIENR